MIRVALIALLLGGCAIQGKLTQREIEEEAITRPELDAIALRMQCRNNARTMVQIARCEGIR